MSLGFKGDFHTGPIGKEKRIIKIVSLSFQYFFVESRIAKNKVLRTLKKIVIREIDYFLKLAKTSNADTLKKVRCDNFFKEFILLEEVVKKDIEAAFSGDPAAFDQLEVVLAYPGFKAILIYRIAHLLANENVPYLPRILTEYAHSKTGIDINPKAKIGSHFFIDHGSGTVIGETADIGDYVKIYQGVTLGAISTRGGQEKKNVKRHPTIANHVTIYANATILGGKTVIGEEAVIGANAFITKSVLPGEKKSFFDI